VPALDDQPAASVRRPGRLRAQPDVIGAIALGGALGAPARYGVAQLVHVAPGTFPWATFWTNVTGSLVLGVVLIVVLERFPPSRYLRPFVATGFLGAYTTYSTFAVETVVLAKDGHLVVAGAYAVASLLVGFAAVWVGMLLARLLPIGSPGGRP
jgi:CrcB protein